MQEQEPVNEDEAGVDDLQVPESFKPTVKRGREPGIKIVGLKNPSVGIIIDVGDCDW